MTDQWRSKTFWVPEALPLHSGVYAPANYIGGQHTETRDPWDAMGFDTQALCQVWCDANPDPHFQPAQHSFADQPWAVRRITLHLEVNYVEEGDSFLTDRLAALLREIADFSEKAVRDKDGGANPEGCQKELPSGKFSWERVD
jgi:hypothetical protein